MYLFWVAGKVFNCIETFLQLVTEYHKNFTVQLLPKGRNRRNEVCTKVLSIIMYDTLEYILLKNHYDGV